KAAEQAMRGHPRNRLGRAAGCAPLRGLAKRNEVRADWGSHLSLGLSASRSQSPSRFTDRASSTSIAPGNTSTHHSPENSTALPLLISVPSEGEVGGTPTPRKLSVASVMMAV